MECSSVIGSGVASFRTLVRRTPVSRARHAWSFKTRATPETKAISDVILDATGSPVEHVRNRGSSGWASQSVYETTSGSKYFVKTASGCSAADMFEGEALGLQALFDTQTMRIPEIVAVGDLSFGSYIVMEYLNFGVRGDHSQLGSQLAQMHLAQPKDDKARAGYFGFGVDNTIGGTPQPNTWSAAWPQFFRDQRLMHQIKLTGDSSLQRLAEPIADNIEQLFEGITVTPSTLHGDLWSGNIATVDGDPALFDPAVYYGHSEADFGMSWCAGFSAEFWRAYFEVLPKEKGFDQRRDLYLAYHYLNHYNLFGSGYYGESERLLTKLKRSMDV